MNQRGYYVFEPFRSPVRPTVRCLATGGDAAARTTHTIQLSMREDGFLADKIVLTTSASYTPTNLGPAESSRQ